MLFKHRTTVARDETMHTRTHTLSLKRKAQTDIL